MSKSEIRVVFLQGGLQVVAEVEEDGSSWILRRPQKLIEVPIPMQTPQGVSCQFLMQMIPLMSNTLGSTLKVTNCDIIGSPFVPAPQVRDMYMQLTTGIQIAH